MGFWRQSLRLWHIWRVLRRHGVDQLWGWRKQKSFDAPMGQRLRRALEELGPVFIKFGQALSTRPDLLPAELAAELALLQDAVSPFPAEQAVAQIEKELGQPLTSLFAEFEHQPLASASVAQVHAARLPDAQGQPGLDVVVKVLRPGIHERVAKDVALLHFLAALADRFGGGLARRLRPREVVAEYEKVITDELDLIREAANASQLRRNWLGSELIYHPLVVWELTRPSVLVLERLYGLPVDEVEELRARGVDFKVLAER
ncbi:MAG: AarF/UbiB family protein, partial [Oceanococcaceae bacterium]